MWDVHSGRLSMSLTGHSGKVTGVDCGPADARVAVTCVADRAIKVGKLPNLLLLLLPLLSGAKPGVAAVVFYDTQQQRGYKKTKDGLQMCRPDVDWAAL